jgi:hypothetical protein
MQSSVPELTDLATEPQSTFDLYGENAKKPGTFANIALPLPPAGRAGRAVRAGLSQQLGHARQRRRPPARQCLDVDQACYGLVQDLKSRGLLDSTLIIWGGEFGRTIYSQGGLSKENYGRDHHPRCYTIWMAGGGIKGGHIHGETDDFSVQHRQGPRPPARLARHDPASARLRSRAVQRQSPGPEPAADRRRAGPGDPGIAGVK